MLQLNCVLARCPAEAEESILLSITSEPPACLWCGEWSLDDSRPVNTASWSCSSSYSALKGTKLCNPPPPVPPAEFVVDTKAPLFTQTLLTNPSPRTSHEGTHTSHDSKSHTHVCGCQWLQGFVFPDLHWSRVDSAVSHADFNPLTVLDRLPNDSNCIEEAPGRVQLPIPIQAHGSNLAV